MKVTVIGCGVMGSAFARHFAKSNKVLLCDSDKVRGSTLAQEIKGTFHEDVAAAVHEADIVLLAVKPKDLSAIGAALGSDVHHKKVLVSILAGTSVLDLKHYFPSCAIVRTMPNLALTCGEGVMGLVDDGHITADVKKDVENLLNGIGLIAWMPESKLDALTALSGSGIGFILVMIEAMIDEGVNLGFTPKEATNFVLQTIQGAAALMRETGKHPAELIKQIASPGGTTMAGLKVMEETGVRAGIIATLNACYNKAVSMHK